MMQLERSMPVNNTFEIKLTLDGRSFAGKDQVLVGIVCTSNITTVQSVKHVYPICIIDGKESIDMFAQALTSVTSEREDITNSGLTVDGEEYDIDFVGMSLLLLFCCWYLFIGTINFNNIFTRGGRS